MVFLFLRLSKNMLHVPKTEQRESARGQGPLLTLPQNHLVFTVV